MVLLRAIALLVAALLAAAPAAADAAAPRTSITSGPSGASEQSVVREVWRGVPGNELASVPVTSPPTTTTRLDRLEQGEDGVEYGDRVRAHLVAPESGTYTFWVAGDDQTQLRLSPDADHEGALVIAHVEAWTDPREWDRFSGQRSLPVTLVAGERYALEVLHKQGAGAGSWAVGWSRPGQDASAPAEIVPGPVLVAEEPATGDATPTFTLGADQPGSTWTCRVDDGAWSPCASALTLPALADGPHVLAARAENAGGEVDPTPVTQRFRVDTVAPETTVTPAAPRPAGTLSRELWLGYRDLAGMPYDDAPSVADSTDGMRGPSSGGDDYVDRSRGFLVAPATGTYTFWVSGDNETELWLAPDDDVAGARRIAQVQRWTGPGEWDAEPGQRSAPVALEAGRRYYVEVRHNDTVGGDHWSVAWSRPGEGSSAPSQAVPPEHLTPFARRHRITFAAPGEPAAAFECRLDEGPWRVCAAPYDPPPLADGWHVLAVRATDAAGQRDATPAEHAFTVDATAPRAELARRPPGGTTILPGALRRELWRGVPGETVADVPVGWRAPTEVGVADSLQTEPNAGDAYGQRLVGLLIAPATGAYTFWLSSDDGSELWLSTTADRADRRRLATVEGWTLPGVWTAQAGQRSAPVPLVAGKRYHVEVLHKDGFGADHLAVGWSRPGQDPSAPSEVVPGAVLAEDVQVPVTRQARPEFAFVAPGSVRIDCSVDGGPYADCAEPLAALADGPHVLRARAVDAHGNLDEHPLRQRFVIDTTPPAAPADLAAPSPARAPALRWAPVADAERYRVLRDGVVVAEPTEPAYADEPSADGAARYAVRAVDAAGNESAGSSPLTVEVDRTAPDTRLAAGPPELTNDATPTLAFRGEGDAAGFECAVDAGAWTPCATPHTVSPLADGPHVLGVRARDAAGNADPTPARRRLTVDTTAPAAPAAPTGAGHPLRLTWTGGEPDFTLRRGATELPAGGRRELRDEAALDRAAPGPVPGVTARPLSPTRLAVRWAPASDVGSPYTYAVRSTDAAGNRGPWSAAATLPATSGVEHYRVLVDGVPVAATTGTHTELRGLPAGAALAVAVQPVDAAGNAGVGEDLPVALGAPAAPRLALTASALVARPGTRIRLAADVAAGSGTPGAVHWRLPDGTAATGPGATVALPRPGTHVVTATVTDEDGLESTASLTVLADGAAPVLAPIVVAGNRVQLRAVDDVAGLPRVEVASRDGRFRRLPADPAALRLPDGRHALRVRLTDPAGNARVVLRRVVVDTTGPRVAVTAPVATARPHAAVALRVADALRSVGSVRVDGRRAGPRAVLRLATGRTHRIEARDAAGNVTRLSLRVRRPPAWPAAGGLDGPRGTELRFDPAGRPLRGARLATLRAAHARLRALGRVPAASAAPRRYDVRLLRAVQRFQRTVGATGAPGTIGPRTRRALDRALDGHRRTRRSP